MRAARACTAPGTQSRFARRKHACLAPGATVPGKHQPLALLELIELLAPLCALSGGAGRIALKAETIIDQKRAKRELTFARLSAIEVERKRFLELRRGKAPASRIPSRIHGRAPAGLEVCPWRNRGPA